MVLEKEINKGIINDDELGEVGLNSASEMDKKLRSKPKAKKIDPSKSVMESKLEEMKRKEESIKEVRVDMLEIKWFTVREDVIEYQAKGGMIHGHTSSYPMEALVLKEEFKERFKNKRKN